MLLKIRIELLLTDRFEREADSHSNTPLDKMSYASGSAHEISRLSSLIKFY